MPIVLILFVIVGLYIGSLSGAGHWAIIWTAVFSGLGFKAQLLVNKHYEKMTDAEIKAQQEELITKVLIAAVVIGVLWAASHITW